MYCGDSRFACVLFAIMPGQQKLTLCSPCEDKAIQIFRSAPKKSDETTNRVPKMAPRRISRRASSSLRGSKIDTLALKTSRPVPRSRNEAQGIAGQVSAVVQATKYAGVEEHRAEAASRQTQSHTRSWSRFFWANG